MAETLTTLNTFGIIGGQQRGKEQWCTVKLKCRVVVHPKEAEITIGEIGEEFEVLKNQALELISLNRADLVEKKQPKQKEKELK